MMRRWRLMVMVVGVLLMVGLLSTGAGAEQSDNSSWVHTQVLARPGPALRSEGFGRSVAIDSDTLVVANPGRRRSTVHVFTRDPEGGGWSHTQEIETRAASVAISGDTLVAAGTVFTRDPATGVWSSTQYVGGGVPVIEGDTLVTGGYRHIVFFGRDPATGMWSLTQEFERPEPLNRRSWGSTTALSGDTLAVAGEHSARARGAVFLYSRDPDTGVWSYTQKLRDPDAEEWEFFGYSVAIEGDTLVVGARGALHLFTRDPADGVWSHTQRITGRYRVVMSGDTLAAPGSDGVDVFTRDPATGVWSFDQTVTNPSSSGGIGALAMSGDTLVTGDSRAHSGRGAVHVFTRGGSPGRVSGTVSRVNGSPLGGSVRVVLGELSADGDVVDLHWVCTDDDGGYVFTGVPLGVDLVAAVTGTGWASHCRRRASSEGGRFLSQYFDGHDGVEVYDSFRITAGFPTFTIDFDLRRPGPGERVCLGELATIEGTSGDDHLVGTDGRDVIVAGGGDDLIDGGGGDDVICGGTGDDTVDGGPGDDIIAGNGDNDGLSGGPGDDIIDGNDGDDTLAGNGGDDWLDGGPGEDTLDGGPGIDTLIDRRGSSGCPVHTGETSICRR